MSLNPEATHHDRHFPLIGNLVAYLDFGQGRADRRSLITESGFELVIPDEPTDGDQLQTWVKRVDDAAVVLTYDGGADGAQAVQHPDIDGPAGHTITRFSANVEAPKNNTGPANAEDILKSAVSGLFKIAATRSTSPELA